MGGFPKFCGVVRFIALGFALLMFACAAFFQFAPQEYLAEFYQTNNITQQFAVSLYFGYGVSLLIPGIIAFIIYGASHKKWKKVLKCKREIGYVFDDMFHRMERGYSDQTYVTIRYRWMNPKKKGHDFILRIVVDVPSSFVNSVTLDTIMSDIRSHIDYDYHNELAPYGFEYFVRVV